MSHPTQFIIENDGTIELSIWVEPEAHPISLLPNEKVVVQDKHNRSPVTVRVWRDAAGATVLSIWPGDSDMVVTKNGEDVLDSPRVDDSGGALLPE